MALRRLILLAPGLTWLVLFLVIPCGLILVYSFFERGIYGGIDYIFGLQNYARALDPLYLKIFLQSFKIALLTTGLALVIGYPAAYFIALAPPRRLPRSASARERRPNSSTIRRTAGGAP